MQFTMRQRPAWPFAKRAALILCIGVLLGFAGPFAGYPPLSKSARYAFWIGMVFAGYAAALAAERLVPKRTFARPELHMGVVALASALPLTFVAAWAISLVRPGHVYSPLQLPALFCAVAVVQLAVVFMLLQRSGTLPEPPSVQNKPRSHPFPSALLSRLPKRLGEDIVALEAEDHYLRVHTTTGSDLVLMRLSDAVAAIDQDSGFQVHRSWWVAHDAICELVRSEQRTYLKMKNGLLVPVGRTYLGTVRSRTSRPRGN